MLFQPLYSISLYSQVVKSDLFFYEHGVNKTLRELQKHIVDSFNKASYPAGDLSFSMQCCIGKGDWKWRREWLEQSRHYNNVRPNSDNNGAGICPRCLAGANGVPWLDPREAFNNPEHLALARDTAVGANIALHGLLGWDVSCEYADYLHAVWLGVARDLVGSALLDLVEEDPSYENGITYDQRLALLHSEIQLWCRANHIRPSTVEDLST